MQDYGGQATRSRLRASRYGAASGETCSSGPVTTLNDGQLDSGPGIGIIIAAKHRLTAGFASLAVARFAREHPFVSIFRTNPFSSPSENIYGNKVSAFPHSGVCCYMNEKIPDPPKKNYGTRPSTGVPVQVQCDGYECMAFLDRDGRWVDLFSRQLMSRVLGVVPA
jgi:hypothetical protein